MRESEQREMEKLMGKIRGKTLVRRLKLGEKENGTRNEGS